ncbi:hypothetical protein [Knoellia subterranea]|uniref:Uncharacterized protein n=1 Tax=Knoellia subterranea KCTC 19937 TaxID=1385521 RepID=A0A0A0JQB9_9MICO|nr:hypothetical protein [Knoellia subterranea]KGN37791.1 hypothetical protein N803_12085 [Knoellia subterranea KCTC 19937]
MSNQPPPGQDPHSHNPYGQNPQGQNPYGQPVPQNPYGAYPPAPGLPNWAKTLFGVLIGLPVSIFAPILAFVLTEVPGPTGLKIFLVTVLPALIGVPFLFGKSTRPWGVGLIIGLAIGSLVLGGLCVSIIEGSSGY